MREHAKAMGFFKKPFHRKAMIPIRITPNVLPVLLTKFSQYSDFELRNPGKA
jgi:hypothetical protein